MICADELGPVSPRTFPPARGWPADGHRLKVPLEYSGGPHKAWVYGALRLRQFRPRHGVTQGEVARAVGAAGPSAVAQWERGTNVAEGIRWERLVDVLTGRRWPDLRAAASAVMARALGAGGALVPPCLPRPRTRETVGGVLAKILEELRTVASLGALRERYCGHDGEWVRTLADRCRLGEVLRADLPAPAGARPRPPPRPAPLARGPGAVVPHRWSAGRQRGG